mmetsp:Transcript_10690/g.19420  ORF Transcript_10690/g.19420 Transcript_10690/m.19420 type:complete len:206 (+) Transcript_10690:714-1331(+)
MKTHSTARVQSDCSNFGSSRVSSSEYPMKAAFRIMTNATVLSKAMDVMRSCMRPDLSGSVPRHCHNALLSSSSRESLLAYRSFSLAMSATNCLTSMMSTPVTKSSPCGSMWLGICLHSAWLSPTGPSPNDLSEAAPRVEVGVCRCFAYGDFTDCARPVEDDASVRAFSPSCWVSTCKVGGPRSTSPRACAKEAPSLSTTGRLASM